MEQAVLGAVCLSPFLPSMDALRSTKKGSCQLLPSRRAVIRSFSSVRPHLKLSEVNSCLSNVVENW